MPALLDQVLSKGDDQPHRSPGGGGGMNGQETQTPIAKKKNPKVWFIEN